MPSSSDYRVQAALVASEIRDRRAVVRSAAALGATLTGVALVFLVEGHIEGSSDAVRFAVSIMAAVALVGTLALLWHQARQLAYLRSFHRLFIEPHTPAADLTELRKDPSTDRPGTRVRELPALGFVALVAALALIAAWSSRGPAGTPRDLAVYGTAGLAAVMAIIVLIGEFSSWDTRLEQLARGVAKMRSEALKSVFVDNQAVLKREGTQQMCVKRSADVPRAELIAAAYFAPDGAKVEPGGGDWLCFSRDPDNPVSSGAGGAEAVATASLPTRLGPSLAVVVGCAGLLFLVLSVLAGPPKKLPGWAFDSPAIYVSARAAVVALVLFVIANLLMNLASGQVLSSIGRSGLGFSGPSTDELVNIDKKTSAAVDDLTTRHDDLQSSTTELASDLKALAQAVGELEAKIED